MSLRSWIASGCMIAFILNIYLVLMSAQDDFGVPSTSWDEIESDFIEEADYSQMQNWGDTLIQEPKIAINTAIEVENKILRSLPLSWIKPIDIHLIRPGTAIVTIISSSQRGYEVYVDGSYWDTEGTTEPLDGQITIRVDGDVSHTIGIRKGSYFREDTKYYEMGNSYTLHL